MVARRPLPVLAVTLLLALGGAALALRLEPSAATDTLVGSSSDSFRATERYRRDFGDEAVVVLVKGELTRTVLTTTSCGVLGLEGCLGGNIPEDVLKKALAQNRTNPRARPASRLRGARAAASGQGGLRAGHLHQHLRRRRSATSSCAARRAPSAQARKAARAARKLVRRARRLARPSRSGWRGPRARRS